MIETFKHSIAVLLVLSFAAPVSARSGNPGGGAYERSVDNVVADAVGPGAMFADTGSEPASTAPVGGSTAGPSTTASPGAGANPWAEPSPAASASPNATPSTTGAAPTMWLWQGSDDIPVPVVKPRRRQFGINPQSDTGLGMHLYGIADLGYSSESQNINSDNAAPRYSNFDGGFSMYLGGFVYSPHLVSYDLSTSYDRNDLAYGDRGATMNGLSYGARISLLQATPVPLAISFLEINNQTDGTLATPFNFKSRSADLAGSIHHLPVAVTYRLSEGSSENTQVTGYDLDYNYHNGAVYVTRQLLGFGIRVSDDYNSSKTSANGEINTQTNNYARLNINRDIASQANLFVDGDWSKYKFGTEGSSSDADVTSLGGGLKWRITRQLNTLVSAIYSRNAVNLFQLLSQTTAAPVANPLPESAVDTHTSTFSNSTSYRPSPSWNLGTTTSYTSNELPPVLTSAVAEQITSGTLSEIGSAGYSHPVWKFVYNGSVSGGVQKYTNQVTQEGTNQDGSGKVYSISSGISGGDDRNLRYGARFTIDQSNNPVFFTLLTSNDRMLDFNFGSRRLRYIRLNASVQYSQREITYLGSTENVSGLNFTASGNCSRLDVMAGRTTSNTLENIFSFLSSATGSVSPLTNLPVPQLYSNSTNEFIAGAWRVRHNLRISSQYTRFAFTVTGQTGQSQDSWWDNNAQYGFGRFDVIGGYVRSTGFTTTSNLRDNRIYFRIKFPFNIW